MLGRFTAVLKPRALVRQTRSLSDNPGSLSKRSAIIKSAPNLNPGVAFENAQYTKRLFPRSTYHPKQLNDGEKYQQFSLAAGKKPRGDVFTALGVNPLAEYKNTLMLSSFVSEMGRIKPRFQTGLTAKSQRRVGKAIRRARSFGLIPVTSRYDHDATHRSLRHDR